MAITTEPRQNLAFFPSRPERNESPKRLEGKTVVVLDVEEATGRPRVVVVVPDVAKMRNGLIVGNNPVNYIDPLGFDQISFFPPGSDGAAAADSRGRPSDMTTVAAHGNPDGTKWQDSSGDWHGAKDLADAISKDPNYFPDRPVKLNICNAGKPGGLGEQVAGILGNSVIATPGTVDTPVSKIGPLKVGWGVASAPAGWTTFPSGSK